MTDLAPTSSPSVTEHIQEMLNLTERPSPTAAGLPPRLPATCISACSFPGYGRLVRLHA